MNESIAKARECSKHPASIDDHILTESDHKACPYLSVYNSDICPYVSTHSQVYMVRDNVGREYPYCTKR